jgi:hypothetical protein
MGQVSITEIPPNLLQRACSHRSAALHPDAELGPVRLWAKGPTQKEAASRQRNLSQSDRESARVCIQHGSQRQVEYSANEHEYPEPAVQIRV